MAADLLQDLPQCPRIRRPRESKRDVLTVWGTVGSPSNGFAVFLGALRDAMFQGDTDAYANRHLTALTDHAPEICRRLSCPVQQAYFAAGLYGPGHLMT